MKSLPLEGTIVLRSPIGGDVSMAPPKFLADELEPFVKDEILAIVRGTAALWELRAPCAGLIFEYLASEGSRVSPGCAILTFQPERATGTVTHPMEENGERSQSEPIALQLNSATTSAKQRARALFDRFDEFEQEGTPVDPICFPGYMSAQKRISDNSDTNDSVISGIATIKGIPAVAVVFEFAYFGGSMGLNCGRNLAFAMSEARRLGLPFVALIASGGARMQEGMAALAQMPLTVAASLDLAAAGIPRIAVLQNPTTGGVYASFAAISDIIVAEAEATVGFAGPRVAESILGCKLPSGSHTARMAFEAGLVDAVVGASNLRMTLTCLLETLRPSEFPEVDQSKRRPSPTHSDCQYQEGSYRTPQDPWEQFELARNPLRPTPSYYIERFVEESFELHGDRVFSDDPGTIAMLARFDGRRVLFLAFDRERPTASGFRKAVRAIKLADGLALPIVTLVDTPGADPSFESEYSGLASAIGETFAALLRAKSLVITAVVGEGGSGGALALACGDVVGIQRHAVFSVIAPEGAAEILYRDPSRSREVASALKPTGRDLVDLGLADEIIPEPEPGAHVDPGRAARMLRDWISAHLETKPDLGQRRSRFRLSA